MHKDKRALVETLRKYKKHILGPLFTESADTIEEMLDEKESKSDSCAIQQPGHWILVTIDDDKTDQYRLFRRRLECSACGEWQTYGKTRYCMNCGKPMEVKNDNCNG